MSSNKQSNQGKFECSEEEFEYYEKKIEELKEKLKEESEIHIYDTTSMYVLFSGLLSPIVLWILLISLLEP